MTEARLEELKMLCERYAERRGSKLLNRLGFGGSAAVYRLQTPSGEVALKVYLPSFLQGEAGLAERRRIELQRGLIGHSCHSLVQFLCIDLEEDTCFIQMEFFPWDDLSKVLAVVPRDRIYPLLGQLVSALHFLDERLLVHRDVKPANVLISPDFQRLIVIDLGVVRNVSDDEDRPDGTDHGAIRPFIATSQYSSPEYLFRTLPPSPELWLGLTFYQIGGVLHDLIARKPLFDEEVQTGNRYAVAYAVQNKMPDFDQFADVPGDLKALTLNCLTKDPRHRLRLVSWDDFSPPSNDLEGIRKRLASLDHRKQRQHAHQQEILKQALDRKEFATKIFEAIASLVREQFAGLMLEPIPIQDRPNELVLRCHLPGVSWAVDFSLEIVWPTASLDAELQVEVLGGGVLVKLPSEPSFEKGVFIALASPGSNNIQATTQQVLNAAQACLSKALSILEEESDPAQQKIKLGG
ncbi:protein kinase domain-containing protein [Polaromonas sp.]|uniref:protein kinase domain-containing protein n=1 Tax=Polaromonas sp. TaxID=1869339 RepID=UPI003BABA0E7